MMSEYSEIILNIAKIQADVEVLKSHLIGNGNTGLVERVVDLEKRANRIDGAVSLTGWAVPIGIAISSIVAGVVTAVINWMRGSQ